jgi:hypothetical protein
MQDRPDISELLRVSRAALLDRVLAAAPQAMRRNILMIANAMDIARRTVEFADRPARAEALSLGRLYPEAPAESLENLNRKLANDIRAGRFDPGVEQRQLAREHLWESTLQKLRESNPKFLKSEGLK